MRLLRRLLILLVVAAVLLFATLFSIQNESSAPLDLLIIQLPEQRVTLWILLAFIVGGVIGMATSSLTVMRMKSGQLALRRKLARYQKELDQLRTQQTLKS